MNKDKKYQDKLVESVPQLLRHKKYVYENLSPKKIPLSMEGKTDVSNSINFPVNINRITKNTSYKEKALSNISPIDIINGNTKLKSALKVSEFFKENVIINMLIDNHLHPADLTQRFQNSKDEYETVVDTIQKASAMALIMPVKWLEQLCQSIGEPARK